MTTATTLGRWRPTHAFARSGVVGFGGLVAGVVLGRPDFVVLAAPLLVVAVWSALRRPVEPPAYDGAWSTLAIREGETIRCRYGLARVDGLESAYALVTVPSFVSVDPESGAVPLLADGERLTGEARARCSRWGRRSIGPSRVVVTGPWGAFRAQSAGFATGDLVTSPTPSAFDTSAPMPHPVGLVGLHRSRSRGEGSEFNSIRPFEVGDRLRRIHWPVSLRTGELHSISSWADQDAHVVLLVDGTDDIGESGGVDGTASTLDVTVRAAAAIAEQYLRGGDRVELRVLDAFGMRRVPPASGTGQLRRILDRLARARPGADTRFDPLSGQRSLGAGATIVMLSSLVAPNALAVAAALAGAGLSVVVVDTLPADVTPQVYDDRFADLAWRIRALERERELHRIQRLGVPVVPWRGAGSLDEVLRDLTRRAAAPRMPRR